MRATVTSAWASMWASSGLGENVDIGTATAPAMAAPNRLATASGRLPMRMPTASPRATPSATRARPTRRASARRSA